MNKALILLTLCALCALTPQLSFAQDLTVIARPIPMDELMRVDPDRSFLLSVCGIMLRVWTWLKQFVYIMAACGLAVMSFQASVMGKFSLDNFVSWGCSLFILAMAEPIIAFLTNGTATIGCTGIQAGW